MTINKVKLSSFFVISCDESSDIVNCAQLVIYVTSADISLKKRFYTRNL
nr:unnamed protein product [Callosobruchus analis]